MHGGLSPSAARQRQIVRCLAPETGPGACFAMDPEPGSKPVAPGRGCHWEHQRRCPAGAYITAALTFSSLSAAVSEATPRMLLARSCAALALRINSCAISGSD